MEKLDGIEDWSITIIQYTENEKVIKTLKKTLWPLFMDGVKLPQG